MRSLTDVFYVKDFDGEHPELEKLVPAKFLIGLDGKPVENPNSTLNTINKLDNHYFNADGTEIYEANPHNYLVVPVNYSIYTAMDFAHRINRGDGLDFNSTELMINAFLPKGGENLQRTYQNVDGCMTQGGKFVPMFQDVASFHLGIVAELSGYGASLAEIGGSAVEIFSRTSSSNNDRNMHSIAAGAAYIQSHIHEIAHPLLPMEPVNNEQSITDQSMEGQFHESRLLEPAHQTSKLHTDAGVGGLAVDVDNEVNNAIPAVNPIINNETLADDGTPSDDSNGYDSDGYDVNGYDSDGYDSNGDDNLTQQQRRQ